MAERDVIIRIRAIDEASAIFKRVAIAAGALVSFFALRRGVEEVVGEFIEAEASSITLAAALRATGEAAGVTTAELEEYADELMNLTTVNDDAFKRIMGIMATFRNGRTLKRQQGEQLRTLAVIDNVEKVVALVLDIYVFPTDKMRFDEAK